MFAIIAASCTFYYGKMCTQLFIFLINNFLCQLQLEEEHKILEKSRSTLEKFALDTVSHLRLLEEKRQKLEMDIIDKLSVHRILTILLSVKNVKKYRLVHLFPLL